METIPYSGCLTHKKPNILLCVNNSCNSEICIKCISAHSEHKLVSIEEYIENILSNKEREIKEIDEIRNKMSLQSAEIKENLIEENHISISKIIDDLKKFLQAFSKGINDKIKYLEEKSKEKEIYLTEISMKYQKEVDSLGNQLEKSINEQEQIKSYIKNSNFLGLYEGFNKEKQEINILDFNNTYTEIPIDDSSARIIISKIVNELIDFEVINEIMIEEFKKNKKILETSEVQMRKHEKENYHLIKVLDKKKFDILNLENILKDLETKTDESAKKNLDYANIQYSFILKLENVKVNLIDKMTELYKLSKLENEENMRKHQKENNDIIEVLDKKKFDILNMENILKDLENKTNTMQKNNLDYANKFEQILQFNEKTANIQNSFIVTLENVKVNLIGKMIELYSLPKLQNEQIQLKRYENYSNDMIEWYNTSHTPCLQNCLYFLNDQTQNIIAWDGKASGWLLFDFKKSICILKTKIRQGCGIWEIQYSDDKVNFITIDEINFGKNKLEANWDKSIGAHRYWRYNLKYNNSAPYYFGYEWHYIN